MRRMPLLIVPAMLIAGCGEPTVVGDSPAAVNGRHATPRAKAEKEAMLARMREAENAGVEAK